MKKPSVLIMLCVISVLMTSMGCRTVHPVPATTAMQDGQEGTIVFVRPDSHSIFGTRSWSDYVEVGYEENKPNLEGLLEVRVGLRNRGGQHWYDSDGPDAFTISAKTIFYSSSKRTVPLYETNWRPIRLLRGAITDYKAVCPRKGAVSYQVILSEHIVR